MEWEKWTFEWYRKEEQSPFPCSYCWVERCTRSKSTLKVYRSGWCFRCQMEVKRKKRHPRCKVSHIQILHHLELLPWEVQEQHHWYLLAAHVEYLCSDHKLCEDVAVADAVDTADGTVRNGCWGGTLRDRLTSTMSRKKSIQSTAVANTQIRVLRWLS